MRKYNKIHVTKTSDMEINYLGPKFPLKFL